MADLPIRKSVDDSALRNMDDEANHHYPMTPPVSAAKVGGNTARNATGKPFQDKMVPESSATKLGKQVGQLGSMLGGIPAGFNAINEALKRKP